MVDTFRLKICGQFVCWIFCVNYPTSRFNTLIHNDQAIFCDKIELTFAGAEPIYGARFFVASVLELY